MATASKNKLFIFEDLEWLEARLQELKEYIDANPLTNLEDRIHWKETAKGGMIPTVTASKETQRKDLTQALKDYAQLLEVINKLREIEEKKIEARGGKEVSGIMAKKMGGTT